ncbi:MAG: hypothetical protein JNN11_03940 [Candidatus Doudnabacteria bacterium]|nr:hypothetical protein [Candidatus Doudnabacteria bacterium]
MTEEENFNSSYAESIIVEWVSARAKEPEEALTKLEEELRQCNSRVDYLILAEGYGLKEPEFNRQMVVRRKMVTGENQYKRK